MSNIYVVVLLQPYDSDLNKQRCQRYEVLEDMDKYNCTIEEREEYYRHIEQGTLLFAGVDYEMILREAEKDAEETRATGTMLCKRAAIATDTLQLRGRILANKCRFQSLVPAINEFGPRKTRKGTLCPAGNSDRK